MSLVAVGASPVFTPVILQKFKIHYFDSNSRDAILQMLQAMRARAPGMLNKDVFVTVMPTEGEPVKPSARDAALVLASKGYWVMAQQHFQFAMGNLLATKDPLTLPALTNPLMDAWAVLIYPDPQPQPVTSDPQLVNFLEAVEVSGKAPLIADVSGKVPLIAAGVALGVLVLVQLFRKKHVS